MPRFFVDAPLAASTADFALPPGAARHVQVLRLQPGDALTLFELTRAVTLAVVMPANDRMDFLVEKATELGAAAVQPLIGERSVLRLAGERADKKRAHWQGVAVAAAEQSGRTVPTRIEPVLALGPWLASLPAAGADEWRGLLSPRAARPLPLPPPARVLVLSGPEGGLSDAEEDAARARGFSAHTLGPRVLRADTAPLAVLSWLALQ